MIVDFRLIIDYCVSPQRTQSTQKKYFIVGVMGGRILIVYFRLIIDDCISHRAHRVRRGFFCCKSIILFSVSSVFRAGSKCVQKSFLDKLFSRTSVSLCHGY